ncbi:MAG TPA: homoserine dehydrogenase [Candidatus Lokiarchaeia archaeon]|nr:homoserine dehydrogenase [Candidatus Lokiarchaeia archaeon]
MVKIVKIGIAGYGTVGKALISILRAKKDYLAEKFGLEFSLVALYEFDGMLFTPEGLDIATLVPETDIRSLPEWQPGMMAVDQIDQQEYDVFVDMTPTNITTAEPAFTHFKKALISGKDVVTSNKGPLMLYFSDVMALANQHGKCVMYEATVGSAIPCIHEAQSGLNGNKVMRIEAILNGTSNYILTRMATEKMDFQVALKEAQERGYAETNPELDIGGHDAAGKLVILANTAMGLEKTINDVKTEGIEHITLDAINMAEKEGFVIKHLGIADEQGNLEVRPKLVPKNSPMGAITGTFNAFKFVTELAKDIIIMGRGAGGIEAAAAVLSDLINVAK